MIVLKMVGLTLATTLFQGKTFKLARPHSNVGELVMKTFYVSFGPSTREVANAFSRPRELALQNGLSTFLCPKIVDERQEGINIFKKN